MTRNEMDCLIFKALQFATAAHEGQTRKYTGDPYIVHPIAVAEMVRRKGGSDIQYIAALLHDTVEDCDVTIPDIEREFGPEVADLVYDLTDMYTKENFPDWNRARRKDNESCRLANISDEAKLIKWCDLADNTSTIVEHDPGFAKVFLKEKAVLLERMGF